MELLKHRHKNGRSSDVEATASLIVSGDCVIPQGVERSPFGASFVSRLRDADLSILNLEAPVTDEPRPLRKSGPHKHTSSRTPEFLAEAGVDAVTLANNHIMDYGSTGLLETMQSCVAADIQTVGAGETTADAFAPLVVERGPLDIGIVNLCEREFGEVDSHRAGVAWWRHPETDAAVEEACERADVVVAIVHGGVEYVPFPPPHLQRRFRRLVEMGVDLVVGHHPHVPQGWEQWGDGLIVYSLGNVHFEQSNRPKTQWGTSVVPRFSADGLESAELVPTETMGGRTTIASGDERKAYFAHLDRVSEITADRSSLIAHWQAQAVRIFQLRYTDWLAKGVGTRPKQMLRHPSRILGQDGSWDTDARQSDFLVLLNLFRNDSHRAVIRTALELETGVATDHRTPEVEDRVDALLGMTEDEWLADRSSRLKRGLDHLARRYARSSLPAITRPWRT